ncbi:MAG: hypothetical protein ED556_02970 [Winogradskyella sp.]|uniref:hypothetical protein n=1 Tax=Winogradskyella sp. TaxID=1883156 RepID=UPI000F3C65CD|nr:hypothetical protein [Winogradskyella sp.]RNC88161.1 MAG: hypothetical protein ED556_02970 [Winogradskyella sp.]
MSENTKPTPQSEEVDLGQLFSYFERFFKKIGSLIKKFFEFIFIILRKIFAFIVIMLNVFYKNFLVVTLAGLIGFAIPFTLDMLHPVSYNSSMLVRQNYDTGKLLYNNIKEYAILAELGDSVNLGRELKIPSSQAAKVLTFSITDNVNENRLVEEYIEHTKSLDSIVNPSFTQFTDRYQFNNLSLQTIFVETSDSTVLKHLSQPIIENITKNNYFIDKRDRSLAAIENKIRTLENLVKKTDTLQDEYVALLKTYYSSESQDTGKEGAVTVNLASTKEKINTKEYNLYEKRAEYVLQINQLTNELEEKRNIIDVVYQFSSPVKTQSPYEEIKIWSALGFFLAVLLFFTFKELQLNRLFSVESMKKELLNKI